MVYSYSRLEPHLIDHRSIHIALIYICNFICNSVNYENCINCVFYLHAYSCIYQFVF